MRSFVRSLRSDKSSFQSLIATIVSVAILLALAFIPIPPLTLKEQNTEIHSRPVLEFDPKISLALFTGIPLFVITIIQLRNGAVLQRSNFIKDFASKLYNERELSESFYYLVYTYDNDTYAKYKNASTEERESMQGNRKEGLRLYDPRTFQFSEEERRLDALLGYFDILGYHYHRGVISIQDIAGVLGFQLTALTTRQVIADYRAMIPAHWKESSFTREFQTVAPYRYLEILLSAFREYNIAHMKEIEKINSDRI